MVPEAVIMPKSQTLDVYKKKKSHIFPEQEKKQTNKQDWLTCWRKEVKNHDLCNFVKLKMSPNINI